MAEAEDAQEGGADASVKKKRVRKPISDEERKRRSAYSLAWYHANKHKRGIGDFVSVPAEESAVRKKEYAKRYYEANKNRITERNQKWRDANPDVVKAIQRRAHERSREVRRKEAAEWRVKNPDRVRANYAAWREANPDYDRIRRETDVQFRLASLLRTRIGNALRSKSARKAGTTFELIGCSAMELKGHLESLFEPGMSWGNQGEWHVDHKRPLASFDLTDPEQQRAACHYTNLQPLWAEDNQRKGARLDWTPAKAA